VLTIGALVVSGALLTLAAIAPLFRRSNPAPWTQRRWVGELVTLSIVCALAIGLGHLGAGVIDAFQTGLHIVDAGLLVVIAVAAVMIGRWLKARAQATASRADAIGAAPEIGATSSGGRQARERARLVPAARQPPHRAA
jgi:hypothetical protein